MKTKGMTPTKSCWSDRRTEKQATPTIVLGNTWTSSQFFKSNAFSKGTMHKCRCHQMKQLTATLRPYQPLLHCIRYTTTLSTLLLCYHATNAPHAASWLVQPLCLEIAWSSFVAIGRAGFARRRRGRAIGVGHQKLCRLGRARLKCITSVLKFLS
jgi:hypothetical protein